MAVLTGARIGASIRPSKVLFMKRQVFRVEPISSHLEQWGAPPGSPVTRAGNMIFVSGLPPFDPELGGPIRRVPPDAGQLEVRQRELRLLAREDHLGEIPGDREHPGVANCDVLLVQRRQAVLAVAGLLVIAGRRLSAQLRRPVRDPRPH